MLVGEVTASHGATLASSAFRVHTKGVPTLKHRGIVYFQNQATGAVMDAHEEEDGLFARWDDFGLWQEFAVEKAHEKFISRSSWPCKERKKTAWMRPQSNTRTVLPLVTVATSPKDLKRQSAEPCLSVGCLMVRDKESPLMKRRRIIRKSGDFQLGA